MRERHNERQTACRHARSPDVRLISPEIEADRHGQIHTLARQFWRRGREGLRAAQQRQGLLVERARARRARDTAVDHTSLPVEAEEDLGDPLFATRLCYRRIALVTLEQRHDLRFPRRHRVRIVPGNPALRGGGRDRGGLFWKRLRRGGRRCRGARLLALRGWDLLGRGPGWHVRVGGGLDLRRRIFDRLPLHLFFHFLPSL